MSFKVGDLIIGHNDSIYVYKIIEENEIEYILEHKQSGVKLEKSKEFIDCYYVRLPTKLELALK